MVANLSNINTFYPRNPQEWRDWLEQNHDKENSVWLIYYKKDSGKASLSWSEAVDQAICFGWIDSVKKTVDDERYIQLFSKRKPKSMWSKINKDKVETLSEQKLMKPAGMQCVDIAKENGMWNFLDDVEALIIPEDLEKALNSTKGNKAHYLSLSKSMQKGILVNLLMAKRPETRKKRLNKIMEQIASREKKISF